MMHTSGLISALPTIDLNHPGRYVNLGVISISVANVVIILLMIALFVAALFLPFPGSGRRK